MPAAQRGCSHRQRARAGSNVPASHADTSGQLLPASRSKLGPGRIHEVLGERVHVSQVFSCPCSAQSSQEAPAREAAEGPGTAQGHM